jgi:hypothetical protein
MTTPINLQQDLIHLKNRGYSSRFLAEAFLGSKSRKSTVNDIVQRYTAERGNSYDTDELNLKKKEVATCMEDFGYSKRYYYSKKTYKDEAGKHDDLVDSLRGDWYDQLCTKSGVKQKVEHQNQRVLLISDLHIPYQHKDAVEFLQHLKSKYNPTRVICLGDECDKHSLSFHLSNPDLPSAGDELKKALPVIAELYKLFPAMDILASNHGSMIYRKAEANGLPKAYIKSYNEVLGVDENWKWHNDLTITLPNGQSCYGHHGKASDVLKLSQIMGMSCYQGHYHESYGVKYWANPNGLYFALQTGCLVDNHSLAFNYNNVNLKKPIIGTALIVDSLPVLEPMVLDNEGRWVGRKA